MRERLQTKELRNGIREPLTASKKGSVMLSVQNNGAAGILAHLFAASAHAAAGWPVLTRRRPWRKGAAKIDSIPPNGPNAHRGSAVQLHHACLLMSPGASWAVVERITATLSRDTGAPQRHNTTGSGQQRGMHMLRRLVSRPAPATLAVWSLGAHARGCMNRRNSETAKRGVSWLLVRCGEPSWPLKCNATVQPYRLRVHGRRHGYR